MRGVLQLILVLTCTLACAAAAQPQTAERCAPLDAALVPYDGGDAPFAVDIAQPEGWSSFSAVPGRTLDYFLGDTESGSDFLFRFSAIGPMDLAIYRGTWNSADPDEISEVEMENGETLAIRHPRPYISFLALVPLPGEGDQGLVINGAVVHATDACDAQALEALRNIVRSVRLRS